MLSLENEGETAPRTRRGTGLPLSVRASPQLSALCERATMGAAEDIKRLAKWSALAEHEATVLRRRLRKQQHDFATLFEMVSEASARSLDVHSMQTYLLRTVCGHFATPRLLIVRRVHHDERVLRCSAAQGWRDPQLILPLDSPLCQMALERRYCFHLNDVPPAVAASPELAELRLLDAALAVPLVQDIEGPGAVLEGFLFLGQRLSGHSYGEEDLEFLHVLGKMLAICLRNESLYRTSIVDDLTGVASRGHFDAKITQEINRIVTYGHQSMGLVMLDVDHFKNVNDRYGHPTGDRVLQEIAHCLVQQVRNVDLVARYGGEEFAIILLEIDRERVLEVAERLRQAVEQLFVTAYTGERLNITASFGVAVFPEDADDKIELIQRADEALYRSKDAGRNRVTTADEAPQKRTRPSTGILLPGQAPQEKVRSSRSGRSGLHSAIFSGVQTELDSIQRKQRQIEQEGGFEGISPGEGAGVGAGAHAAPTPAAVATLDRRRSARRPAIEI